MKLLKRHLMTALLAFSSLCGTAFADTYIVTAEANKQAIDLDAAKKIFKGDVTKWDDGKSIVIVVPDIASADGGVMLSKLYGMSDKEYKKYWMQKVFKGEVSNPPESKAAAAMVDFLKAYPNAVGVISGASANGVRKVLKID